LHGLGAATNENSERRRRALCFLQSRPTRARQLAQDALDARIVTECADAGDFDQCLRLGHRQGTALHARQGIRRTIDPRIEASGPAVTRETREQRPVPLAARRTGIRAPDECCVAAEPLRVLQHGIVRELSATGIGERHRHESHRQPASFGGLFQAAPRAVGRRSREGRIQHDDGERPLRVPDAASACGDIALDRPAVEHDERRSVRESA